MLIPQNALTGFNIPNAGDPYFNRVVLACHMDGANGSTTIIDQKGHALTAVGAAALSTSQFKFGTASLSLTVPGDCVSSPDSADWNFGSGDFTIDGWFRLTTAVTALSQVVVGQFSNADQAWIVYVGAAGKLNLFVATNDAGSPFNISGATVLSNATWYHFACVRDGNVGRVYIDGVQDGSGSVLGTMLNSAQTLLIGEVNPPGTNTLFGNIDDLRATGACRYPGGTTFAVPTAAFPNS